MQKGGKISNFLIKLDNKFQKFDITHPWILWTTIYSLFFIITIITCFSGFYQFHLFQTDVNSARYLLSALIQCQAAIISIVITLTLIAVQMTASTYTPRVTAIFGKNPNMWLLLFFYALSIVGGALVLKTITGNDGTIPNTTEIFVSIIFALGIFTLIALFIYIRNIIELLKVENIVKRLANEIDNKDILDEEKGALQSIFDIIHKSIMNYDLATMRGSLSELNFRFIDLINANTKNSVESEGIEDSSNYFPNEGSNIDISNIFCRYIERCSRIALKNDDEESIIEILTILDLFAQSIAEQKLEQSFRNALDSIKTIGILSLEFNYLNACSVAEKSIGRAGKNAAINDLDFSHFLLIDALEEIGCLAVAKGVYPVAMNVILDIESIEINAANNNIFSHLIPAVKSIERIALDVQDKEFEEISVKSIEIIKELSRYAFEANDEDGVVDILRSLDNIACASMSIKFEGTLYRTIRTIRYILDNALDKHFNNALSDGMTYYGRIGEDAVVEGENNTGIDAIAKYCLEDLDHFSQKLIENNANDAAQNAINAFIRIGSRAHRIPKQVKYAGLTARCLARCKRFNPEIVDSTFKMCKHVDENQSRLEHIRYLQQLTDEKVGSV